MTEPYTAEELVEVTRKLLDAAEVVDESGEAGFDGANDPPDLARLAATLREYERVVKENAEFREAGRVLERYGVTWSGDSQEPLLTPMADGYWTPWHVAEAEVTALRADKERLDWIEENRCDVTFSKRAEVDGEDDIKVNRWTVWPYRGFEVSRDWSTLREALDAARAAGEG